MSNFKPIDYALLVSVILGLVLTYFLSNLLEPEMEFLSTEAEVEQLSLEGKRLKGFSLGQEPLIADWYWVRSLQYVGNKLQRAREKNIQIDLDDLKSIDPRLLYPLLDNATTLDPQFLAAYHYGATVLPAVDRNQAIKLTKKGIENNPEEWKLYHLLGFIYWKLGEYETASKTYAAGAKIDGALPWMTSMAARMKREGGSREMAREIYQQMYDAAEDSKTREQALIRLKEIDAFYERDVLDAALAIFKKQNGSCAKTWKQLVPLLRDKKPANGKELRVNEEFQVVDPSDTPYEIDEEACKSKIGVESKIPRS